LGLYQPAHETGARPVIAFPYGQYTHPALRHLKKFKYFNADELMDGTGGVNAFLRRN